MTLQGQLASFHELFPLNWPRKVFLEALKSASFKKSQAKVDNQNFQKRKNTTLEPVILGKK